MKITFIAAMSLNRVIGNHGLLPWHLPNDLQHFKKLTVGKHILMGRKTFDSLKKPLPNRYNYVLTKNNDFLHNNVQVLHSKMEAMSLVVDELFVIGGEELFRLFMPECEKIHLTIVDAILEGDAYFPDFTGFTEKTRHDFMSDEKHRYNYSFIEYTRAAHHVLP